MEECYKLICWPGSNSSSFFLSYLSFNVFIYTIKAVDTGIPHALKLLSADLPIASAPEDAKQSLNMAIGCLSLIGGLTI